MVDEKQRIGPEGYDPIWDDKRGLGGYYSRDGTPMSMREWANDFDRNDKKRVAATHVADYWISTVWLGMDHSFGEGPPLIFETMVFNQSEVSKRDKEDWLDKWCDRYATEERALAGHAQVVAMVEERVQLLRQATREGK